MIRPDQGKYPITQYFGANPEIYSRFGLAGHNGWDLGCPNDTVLVAPHPGRVTEINLDPEGYGLYVKIESTAEGSLLAHNQEILVQVGQNIDQGQAVAKSNNTGFSTGPHSHWGYFRQPRDRSNGYAGYIDPTPYLTESDTIAEEMPQYLKTLLQENNLTNESQIREFFEKARQYEGLVQDLQNCQQSLTNTLKTADLSQLDSWTLLKLLIKKILS